MVPYRKATISTLNVGIIDTRKHGLMRFVRRRLTITLLALGTSVCHSETVTYFYTDTQGTVVATADMAGNMISMRDYRPYGTQALGLPDGGPGFTGHLNDPSSGFVYMQARYYDPDSGRFLSTDPEVRRIGDVERFGRFTYANGNPTTNVDPSGRSACPGQSRSACIQSDTFVASRSTGQTVVASQAVREAMVSGKSVVAVATGGSKEKIGFVTTNAQGGYHVSLAVDSTTARTSTTDSASAVKPEGAVAVLHGHIDGRSDGVVSPADAQPITQGLPNGVVSEGRVGVTQISNGRLQFQMIDGRMSRHESESLQKSLDKQQLAPEFMNPGE